MRIRIKIRTSAKRRARLGAGPRSFGSFGNAQRSAQQWFALGTAATYLAAGGGGVLLSQSRGSAGAAQAASSQVVVRFEIPGGALGTALEAFQRATNWQIEVPEPDMLMVETKGVRDVITAEQGLRRLLAGTGLSFTMTGATAASLQVQEITVGVDVTARRPLASVRYTEPLRDIPQTITVIPREIIEQQGATSLTDVLRNVPGLTITAGEGGAPAGDNLTLRGNSARNDIFVDGVRDLSPQSRDPFNLESVEVTKGPTSAIAGRGSAGGTINLVSKAPGTMRSIAGSVALGNADTRRASIDVNTSLARLGLGERTGFRLNGLVHNAGVAGRDVVKNDRWGLAPSLAVGLGTPTRLTFGYYKLRQDNISDYGIPWVPNTNNALVEYRDRPAPVPRNTFYGFRDRDREVLNQDTATVRFEHDFSDTTRLQSQLRFGKSGRNSVATPPRLASVDSTAINREMRSWIAQDRIWDSQTDFRASGSTGTVQHSVVVGMAFTNERNTRITRTAPNSPTTLLNPNPDDVYTGAITVSPNVGRITGNTQSVWAFDTAKFGQHWEATGGARFDRFDVNGIGTAAATATPAVVQQNVKFASVRAGLIYKPVQSGSIYTSYGSSVSPSLEGLSYNTSNTTIPPEKTYTNEIGAKWEVAGNRLLLAGALFRVAKDNARTPGLLPTDPPQVLAGRQVSQGIEFSASGAVTRQVRVLASYTLIDARIRSSNNAAEVGRYFQNTPRNAASVWITYTARKFTLGVGPRFTGRRFGNNTNLRQVPSYKTVDLMASYNVNRHWDLRLNVNNLGDAYYFDRLGGGHLVPAAGRYMLLSSNFRF